MAYPKRNPAEMSDDSFESNASGYAPKKKMGWSILVTIIVIVVLAAIGYFAYSAMTGGAIGGTAIAPVSDEWQAVFLTNGQVYFGKVKEVSVKTLTLADIYYLQIVTKPLQQSQQGEGQTAQTQQELTLIKLGNEIHGPQDAMVINTDQVLLTEKLKKDSKVVEAINNYLKEQTTKK